MSAVSLSAQSTHVNSRRFVAPLSESEKDFGFGKHLYKCGKPLSHCLSDAMADGWLTAEAAGADAYWLSMMQEAN